MDFLGPTVQNNALSIPPHATKWHFCDLHTKKNGQNVPPPYTNMGKMLSLLRNDLNPPPPIQSEFHPTI